MPWSTVFFGLRKTFDLTPGKDRGIYAFAFAILNEGAVLN